MDKLDLIQKDISEIKVSQARTEQDLKYHIKRTDLAEENIKLLREDIKPLAKHKAMFEGALKLIGILSIVLGLIYTTTRLIKGI